MRLIKIESIGVVINLDRVATIETVGYQDENHPDRKYKVVVDGSNNLFYLESDEEKERFLNAVFCAYRDDRCIELDNECLEIDGELWS